MTRKLDVRRPAVITAEVVGVVIVYKTPDPGSADRKMPNATIRVELKLDRRLDEAMAAFVPGSTITALISAPSVEELLDELEADSSDIDLATPATTGEGDDGPDGRDEAATTAPTVEEQGC